MNLGITIWQSDAEIITILGKRIREKRLQLNVTQSELAKEIGLTKLTIQKIEKGQGSKLDSFIRILRFFSELDALDQILKPQNISPKELFEQRSKKQKQRARKSK